MKTGGNRKGVALLITVIVLVVIIGLSLGMLTVSLADKREAVLNRELAAATALAEGATEVAHKEVLVSLANYRAVASSGIAVIDGHNVTYTITPIGSQRIETDSFGVQTIIQPYTIAATATSNGISKHVEKIIDAERTPIFQFMAFYHDDLEMLPGPSMHLYGRVHSNRDLYIGCGNTLTLETNYVRAGGHMYRRRKNDNTSSTGSVMIQVAGSAGVYANMESRTQFAPSSANGFDSKFLGTDINKDGDCDDSSETRGWTLRSLDLWKGTVQTAEHGTKQIEPPSVGTTNLYVAMQSGTGGDYSFNAATGKYVPVTPGTGKYEKGYFYRNADISVVDGKVYDKNALQITTWPKGTPISTTTFYDGRQNKNVTVTNIDVAKLASNGRWPANGLLYTARTEATASQPNGIRLINGGVLAGPFTVVSQNPVYTKGNFNIGDATHAKQPAAVMTDSFNILSTAWNDTKTAGNLPAATTTTINAAFITGSYGTSAGDYNGGIENLPRFHENWNGVTCKIRGSFVNVWDSELAKGQWGYGGDNYTAPTRDWNYDTDFNDFTKLPPYTPSVVGTTRVVWVSR